MDFGLLADQFFDSYGLFAVFGIMLLKELGVPIPIPGDLLMLGAAARAAQGKFTLLEAFLALFVPMIIGGLIQYWVARGPARQLIYRLGKFVGLTKERLDRAMDAVRKGGVAAVALGLTTPGVRITTVPASGLAELPLSIFTPGLVAGSAFFLAWHFAIGYLSGAALALLNLPLPVLVGIVVAVIVLGIVGWIVIRKIRRPKTEGAVLPNTYSAWADSCCPACIAITLIRERNLAS